MIAKKLIRVAALMTFITSSAALVAAAETEGCAVGWTSNPVRFESVIQYDDLQTKVNPTVHVYINGKAAKMMLDTGANINVLWDASLIDTIPGVHSQKIDAHVAFAEAQKGHATLADDYGNATKQSFYLVTNAVLSEGGYSGALSPQAIAANNAIIVDFEKNCFFISPAFNLEPDDSLEVRRGVAISNPHRVMAIPVHLGGGKIPLIVDSGASQTSILASLIASKPKGQKSPKRVDIFGAEIPSDERVRLVDFSINGKVFKSHPVIPKPTISDKGIVDFGFIGMDVLKNHVIYYDGAEHQFILMTRKSAAQHALGAKQRRTK